MRLILTIAVSALVLSGCIAEWKNPNGPQRWSGSPDIPPMHDSGTAPLANSGTAAVSNP